MHYDGSSKLSAAIADLFRLSAKSHNQIAERIAQAKTALSVTSNTRHLSDDEKLAIYRWHYERLNPVQDVKQPEPDSTVQNIKQVDGNAFVQYIKQDVTVQDEPVQSVDDAIVQDVKQNNLVYDIKQGDVVQDVKQDVPIQGDADNSVYDFKQVHFAVTFTHQGQPKRTTVMLEGYLVKALQRKHGLDNNAAIRAWIEQAIKADGVRFDSFAPLTRQVKRLIVESFV